MCRFLFTLLLYPLRDEISFTFFTHRKGSAIGLRPRLVLRTHLKQSFYVHLADGRLQIGHPRWSFLSKTLWVFSLSSLGSASLRLRDDRAKLCHPRWSFLSKTLWVFSLSSLGSASLRLRDDRAKLCHPRWWDYLW